MEKTIKKCLLIALMSMIFWVISFSIMGLVGERIKLSDETQTEVAETWSRKQDFVGPILCVPVVRDSQNVVMPYTCMYVLPDRIELTTDVESEVLHRGIFDALVYRSKLSGGGMFNLKEMKTTGTMAGSSKPVRFDWSNTQVIIAINDKRGIEDAVKVKIGGKAIELNQSFHNYGNSNLKHIFNTDKELVCKIIDLSDQVGNEAVAFDIATELKGSDELNLSPIGNVSVLTMQGNCKDPSFIGFMLPSNREVTDDGFKATWKISSLNRNDVGVLFPRPIVRTSAHWHQTADHRRAIQANQPCAEICLPGHPAVASGRLRSGDVRQQRDQYAQLHTYRCGAGALLSDAAFVQRMDRLPEGLPRVGADDTGYGIRLPECNHQEAERGNGRLLVHGAGLHLHLRTALHLQPVAPRRNARTLRHPGCGHVLLASPC